MASSGTYAAETNAEESALGSALISFLRAGVIRSHIHIDLGTKYHVDSVQLQQKQGHSYTKQEALVPLSDFEEWPVTMGDALWLVREPTFSNITGACEAIRRLPADNFQPVERLILQAELWVAFDSLYLQGTRPETIPNIPIQPWRAALWDLAQTMRHLALSFDEIAGLPNDKTSVVKDVCGNISASRFGELFNLNTLTVHDDANQYRRVTHLYYFDPTLDFGMLTTSEIATLLARKRVLAAGSIGLLEENAIALTPSLAMVPTQVPLIVKTYKVIEQKEARGAGLEFQIFRTKRSSVKQLTLERFPDASEGWALLDLPNIPGHNNQPAFRAPYAVVCQGCHAGYPLGFDPGFGDRDSDYMRVTTNSQDFSATWNIRTKANSAEWKALQFFWVLPNTPSSGDLSKPTKLNVGFFTKDRSRIGWRSGSLFLGAFISAVLLLWLKRKRGR